MPGIEPETSRCFAFKTSSPRETKVIGYLIIIITDSNVEHVFVFTSHSTFIDNVMPVSSRLVDRFQRNIETTAIHPTAGIRAKSQRSSQVLGHSCPG